MADDFGEGIPVDTQASAGGTPATAPETTAVSTPVAPESTSLLEAFRSRVGDVEGISNDDQLAEVLGQMIDRDNALRSTIGDTADESRLRQLLESEQRYQQIAPKLTQYEQWLQSQQAQPVQQQPAPTPTPAPQSSASAAAAAQRRWERMEFDQSDWQYLEPDQATGLFRAKRPELAALADKANAFARRKRQIDLELTSDPYAFGQEIVSPHIEPLLQKLQSLEQQLAQMSAQSTQQTEWQQFLSQHGNDLQAFDVTTGAFKPTKAGEVWEAKVNQLVSHGMTVENARQVALELAREITGSATVGNPPAQQPTPQKVITRLKTKPTDVVSSAAGTLNVADVVPQNGRRLTGRARMQELIAEEMHAQGLAFKG